MPRERDFLDLERQDVAYRPVKERVKDFRAVDVPLTDEQINVQAARCMNCGTPFCHAAPSGCPLGNLVPEWNEQVYNGRWKEALDLLQSTNCFPEFTGRICPAPCEGACVLGLIRPAVNICKIELAISDEGFRTGNVSAHPPGRRREQHVAIAGSGPAGLSAAFVLNRAGFNVTVYEKNPNPGGILRYGIPDFKLEKSIVDRRIGLMRDEGVTFECGVTVGSDVSARFLQDRFDAIVLAGGAGIPRDLAIPGRDLSGIHFAMDFLTQQNRMVDGESISSEDRITAEGKRVVVIGGGDTGSDCVGTSWRQGAKDVVQLEILPEPPAARSDTTPWPEWPLMRRDSSSHKEGGTRLWNVDTTAFVGENGSVSALQCSKVEWEMDDSTGRLCPHPVDTFEVEADLVLLALGFVGPGPTALIEDLQLAKNERGFLSRDDSHMTNVPGVFVAGDMQRGPSLVVHAINDGMRTASLVADYLTKDS